MSMKKYDKSLRKEFIEALIEFSEGGISEKEANDIADNELRCSDYYDGSPTLQRSTLAGFKKS